MTEGGTTTAAENETLLRRSALNAGMNVKFLSGRREAAPYIAVIVFQNGTEGAVHLREGVMTGAEAGILNSKGIINSKNADLKI